jgi:hypothetical protein
LAGAVVATAATSTIGRSGSRPAARAAATPAAVTLKVGAQISTAELRDFVKQRVAACKYPRNVRFRRRAAEGADRQDPQARDPETVTRETGVGRGAAWEPRKSSRVVGSRARGSSVTTGMTMTGNVRAAARRADVRSGQTSAAALGCRHKADGVVVAAADRRAPVSPAPHAIRRPPKTIPA